MGKYRNCFSCSAIGAVISAVVGIVVGYFVSVISCWWIGAFIQSIIFLAVISIAVFLAIGLVNACLCRNKEIRESLCKVKTLLTIGIVGTIVFGIILSVIFAAVAVPFVTIRVLVGFCVLFAGMLLTAIICFMLNLINCCFRQFS